MLPAPPTDVPPSPPPPPAESRRTPRPGQLTFGWRVVFGLAWAGVIVAFIAVGKASRDVGLATWWLGPAGDQQPFWVMLLPFAAPSALVIGVLYRARYLPWLGLGAAGVTAAVGLGDVGRVNGLAVVELALAAAGAAVSVAALAGRYR